MNSDVRDIKDELRSAGLRATAARCAALRWLDTHAHATAEQVHQGVHAALGTISRQAVYDVLAACVQAQLVRQIRPAGHPARFERRRGDNHHHLVCRDCGSIVDTGCATEHSPCLMPSHGHGFVIDEAEIVFWGQCDPCRIGVSPGR